MGLGASAFDGRIVPTLPNLDSVDNEADNQPDDQEIEHHLDGDDDPGRLSFSRDVAEPDRRENGR